MEYDFSGWATRNDIACSDGRTIRRDAFKDCDGKKVPLVWNHRHDNPENILGHALLENRKDGVYAYCKFNDTNSAQMAKKLIKHGDVESLSIYANRLQQNGGDVMHGDIKEVSLVVAGANPGAFIEFVDMSHSDTSDSGVIINPDIAIAHADEPKVKNEPDDKTDDGEKESDAKTVKDVFDTLTDEQKTVVYAIVGAALENKDADKGESEEGDNKMKHNVFDNTDSTDEAVLSHAAQGEILETAKLKSVGSLQNAIQIYQETHDDTLQHGFEDITVMFPEYKDVPSGMPVTLTRDQNWIGNVVSKAHKSPISRIRTRQIDARGEDLRAYGYKAKGTKKKDMANWKLIKRTTDPQTIYIKDSMHRDDIIDITDFDVVNYQWNMMRQLLDEELAMAIMVGDGREDGDDNKISEEHIRSIWHDDDLYTIHYDIDVDAARKAIQGTNTAARFGDNYVYAEAIIEASLYSREQYKGSGSLEFYCTPHLLNIMLLARDLNGRRIYDSTNDLAAALNVSAIHTVEQFVDLKERTDKDQKKHKLLGLFVNLSDYTIGSTKGGEITRFNQFDIDFNQEKYLIETRLSGALTKVYSAIALEEPVGD